MNKKTNKAEKTSETARLHFQGKVYELPTFRGTEGQVGIDISHLRQTSGCFTFDNGFANTASCKSAITFVDGENGFLRYRGYDILDLVENCTFVEVAYLLAENKLPTAVELENFSEHLNQHSMIHEDMHNFFSGFPPNSHPMAILSAMVTSLSSFYPYLSASDPDFIITVARLLSKVRTIAAFSYKKSLGEPLVYPRYDLNYCANFLNMMFSSPVNDYKINPEIVKALNQLFILHADHEQNCSTSAVRLVASTGSNLYASISAGISALWGHLHGGANQAVIEMLTKMHKNRNNIKKLIARAKNKNDNFKLSGFGHAVYKNYDPRAKTIKAICDNVLSALNVSDPLLEVAKELEELVLKDEYFIERRLYPNVDFYTGIVYRAMGIPTMMLTVMFTIGRLPGWIAHWKECVEDGNIKIWRPRQIYIGPNKREFVPLDRRMK
ncbi:MAG: citrate synthase [Chitinivibrionales bacterium]|nr:citrate synthase [Chitinivibrionales bacterium]